MEKSVSVSTNSDYCNNLFHECEIELRRDNGLKTSMMGTYLESNLEIYQDRRKICNAAQAIIFTSLHGQHYYNVQFITSFTITVDVRRSYRDVDERLALKSASNFT